MHLQAPPQKTWLRSAPGKYTLRKRPRHSDDYGSIRRGHALRSSNLLSLRIGVGEALLSYTEGKTHSGRVTQRPAVMVTDNRWAAHGPKPEACHKQSLVRGGRCSVVRGSFTRRPGKPSFVQMRRETRCLPSPALTNDLISQTGPVCLAKGSALRVAGWVMHSVLPHVSHLLGLGC